MIHIDVSDEMVLHVEGFCFIIIVIPNEEKQKKEKKKSRLDESS